MKKILLGFAAASLAVLPSAAFANAKRVENQSVYRTVETTVIYNDNGSTYTATITTVYYLFGYE